MRKITFWDSLMLVKVEIDSSEPELKRTLLL